MKSLEGAEPVKNKNSLENLMHLVILDLLLNS